MAEFATLDLQDLREAYRGAEPFPFVMVDGFLEPGFAREVARSYPSYAEACGVGLEFRRVNEVSKVQVAESRLFPPAVRRLHELLASPRFLELITEVTGIPRLLADPELAGGGMHLYASGAHLDVHVDFNLLRHSLHRRLNILLFLNEEWRPEWGGMLEFWDRHVRERRHAFLPSLNRCVIFETSEASFHGVTKVLCRESVVRKSFAGYYYTREAPVGWDGSFHSTVFRARPGEWAKKALLMPGERLARRAVEALRAARRRVIAR